nr:PPE domain-containing protein [Mycobacterium persicum]
MLAVAAAWDGLAFELASAAAAFGSVTSGLANESWQGPRGGGDVRRGRPLSGLAECRGVTGRGGRGPGPRRSRRVRGG